MLVKAFHDIHILDTTCVYVVCTFSGEKKSTKVIDNNLDPEWNEVSYIHTFVAMCAFVKVYLPV